VDKGEMMMEKRKEKRLFGLIEGVSRYQLKIKKIDRVLQELKEEYKAIKDRYIKNIHRTEDEKGKPVYSSRRLRRIEANLEIVRNKETIALWEEIRKLDKEKDRLLIEYNRLQKKKGILEGLLPEEIVKRMYPGDANARLEQECLDARLKQEDKDE